MRKEVSDKLEKIRLAEEIILEGHKLLARGINPVIVADPETMERMERELRRREERMNALRRKMEENERTRPHW